MKRYILIILTFVVFLSLCFADEAAEKGKTPVTTTPASTTGDPAAVGLSAQNQDFKKIADAIIKKTNGPYDMKNDKACFVFDMYGNLWNRAPVNLDADDIIDVYLIYLKTDTALYKMSVIGEYNPSDLEIGPNDSVDATAQSLVPTFSDKYAELFQEIGPFTSDQVTIVLSKKEKGKTEYSELSRYQFNVNKLYNMGFGISFIKTYVKNPSYTLLPLADSINTIRKIDNNNRTMATANVIIYWGPTLKALQTFSQKVWAKKDKAKPKGHILPQKIDRSVTRGRDIVKEPDFLGRINPTFGVSLDKDWNTNFFYGLTFELSRGIAFVAGMHDGEVRKLADKNFNPGVDEFAGKQEDIKLTKVRRQNLYFGVTLDSRATGFLFPKSN